MLERVFTQNFVNMSRRILCFGDSLTEGWIDGGKDFKPYTNQLQKLFDQNRKLNYTIFNEGVSGEPVKEMHSRLPKVLELYKNIDLLILQGGTNDILLYKEPNVFEEFLKVFKVVKDFGIPKVLLLNIMEGIYTEYDGAVMTHKRTNEIRLATNEKLSAFVEQNKDVYTLCDIAKELEMYSLKENEKKVYWDDLIHPSVRGYDKMADIIHKTIMQNKEIME